MYLVREFWHYRELLYFLALRDIQVRYKQAALGAAWAVLQPLLTMGIFTLFFSRVVSTSSSGIPYPLFTYSGLVPWMYLATTLNLGGNSLINNTSLITKVFFPRSLLPGAAALSNVLDLAVSAVFLVILMMYYGVHPGPLVLVLPVLLAMLVLLSLSLSMWLAAMNVSYRDIKYAIPFGVQIWMYATPIIYPLDFLPPRFRPFLELNPMTGIVEAFRAAIFSSQPMPWVLLSKSAVITLVLFVVGSYYYRKAERTFADVV